MTDPGSGETLPGVLADSEVSTHGNHPRSGHATAPGQRNFGTPRPGWGVTTMQIRLMGLPSEIRAAVDVLRATDRLDLVGVSGEYQCRESRQVRVYVRALVLSADPEVAS